MGAPINSFEIIESIRFFAQLVGTEGLSTRSRDITNEYIERLLEALRTNVDSTTAQASGLKLV